MKKLNHEASYLLVLIQHHRLNLFIYDLTCFFWPFFLLSLLLPSLICPLFLIFTHLLIRIFFSSCPSFSSFILFLFRPLQQFRQAQSLNPFIFSFLFSTFFLVFVLPFLPLSTPTFLAALSFLSFLFSSFHHFPPFHPSLSSSSSSVYSTASSNPTLHQVKKPSPLPFPTSYLHS